MDFQSFLFQLHSGVRWIVVFLSLLVGGYFVLRTAGSLRGANADRPLMMAFTIGIDIQVLLGIILIIIYIINSGFQGYQIGHLVIMLVAAGVAHMGSRLKAADDRTRARNNLLVILAVLLLVFVGVMALPGGTARWGIIRA